jgi:alpha-N-arabinofuranosidase
MNPTVDVRLTDPIATIHPHLYGHFAEHLGSCVYEGIWVGEDSAIPNIDGIRTDVLSALKEIRPSVIRWPGGCFADDYHWEDGIGPQSERPNRVNIHWGNVVEPNAFGTHEFILFCRLLGAEPYLCGNVGGGHPRELRDWIEYCNYDGDSALARRRRENGSEEPFRVRYWGVGNENWGCGGEMKGGEYAEHYRRFAGYCRNFAGTDLFLIACGPNGNDVKWTRDVFDGLQGYRKLHGFSAHFYCGTAGTSTEYSADQWYELIQRSLYMERLVVHQRALLDGYDPDRRIGLIVDEWGTWHPAAPDRNPAFLWQQNTVRDALVAAATLDIFNRHADKVVMSNIAQMINVLQAMILTDGPRMIVTPTYHVYRMYRNHQGGLSLRTAIEAEEIEFAASGQSRSLPRVMGSASRKGDAALITLTHVHAGDATEVEIRLRDGEAANVTAETLASGDIRDRNTFDEPGKVKPRSLPAQGSGSSIRVTLPPASVTTLSLRLR